MESLDSYNDYFDPLIPFGLNYNWDVDGTDTSHDFNDQSQNYDESNTLSQTTNKILQLSEKLYHWSSKFVVCPLLHAEPHPLFLWVQLTKILRIQELSINFILTFSAAVITVNQM